MTISNLTGNECGTEVAKKINSIIAEKASVSLDNLDATGQAIIDGKVSSSDLYDSNQLIKINKLQTYSLPSGSYVDLTVGTSGATYTAPADGWYCINVYTIGTNNMYLINNTTGFRNNCSVTTTANHVMILPIKKGDVMAFNYEATLNFSYAGFFRFYYAEGSEPQN